MTRLENRPKPTLPARPIGGFFELEIPPIQTLYHHAALALSTGRACLMVALQQIRPKRALVPHYTCDATLQPFRLLNIDVEFYRLDDNFRPSLPLRNDRDLCCLLTNYWGLQRSSIDRFANNFGSRLIVDNTHDYFFRPNRNFYWSFTSARKWFGVPDGAFLYAPADRSLDTIQDLPNNQEINLQHSLDRHQGNLAIGYANFQAYEQTLDCSIKRISDYSASTLSRLDHDRAANQRQQNFDRLAKHLKTSNHLSPKRAADESPFCYPYLPASQPNRKQFHDQQIFIPQLWKDVIQRAPAISNARRWSEQLLPIPIDQRYGTAEMDWVASAILQTEPAV